MLVNRCIRVGVILVGLMLGGRVMAGGIEVKSPDGGIRFLFRFTDGLPEYGVVYKGVTVIDRSPLSLRFAGMGLFGAGLAARGAVITRGEDNYDLVVGKVKSVHDAYLQAVIPLEEKSGRRRRINFIVRVFNDGVAFRYQIPDQAGWTSYSLVDEGSCFRVGGDPMVMASFREGFTTSHEGLYWRGRLSQVKQDTLMDMPIFLDFGGEHIYAAITEARLVDYAGMYLIRHGDMLKSELSPLPGQPGGVEGGARIWRRGGW